MEKRISEIVRAYRADDNKAQSYHFHNGYELIFIEKGSSEFIINHKAVHYKRNHIIFINQMEQHQMKPLSSEYIRYVVIFDPDYFDRYVNDQILCSIFKQRPENFQNGFELPDSDAAYILKILKNCVSEHEAKQPFSNMSIMSGIVLLLINLYRNFSTQFPSVKSNPAMGKAARIQNYIDRHFLEDITIDFLSDKFHLNKYYMMDFFKEVTGYTLKRYVALKRISHAKNLLFYSDKNISEIAIACGFNSVSNFIRSFKNHEGITPLSFRKLNGKE